MWFLISTCERKRERQLIRCTAENVNKHNEARKTKTTYEVVAAAEPLGSVFLQKTLQQVSGCVGNVRLEL